MSSQRAANSVQGINELQSPSANNSPGSLRSSGFAAGQLARDVSQESTGLESRGSTNPNPVNLGLDSYKTVTDLRKVRPHPAVS